MPPLEERTEYPYQNIRVKNFPWGDGDKTLLYVLYSTSLSWRKRDADTWHSWNSSVNYHNKDKTT